MTSTKYTAKKEKKPPNPEDIHIPSKNCCGKCIYNIPQGTFMLLLPGLGLLFTGTVILSWSSADDVWHAGVKQAGLILVILGGALTLGGVVYWTYMWCKTKPEGPPSRRSVSPQKMVDPVSLVGVYRLRHDGNSLPAAELGQSSNNGAVPVHTVATIS